MNRYAKIIVREAMKKTMSFGEFVARYMFANSGVKKASFKTINQIEDDAIVIVAPWKRDMMIVNKNKDVLAEVDGSMPFFKVRDVINKVTNEKMVEVYITSKPDFSSTLTPFSHMIYSRKEFDAWKKKQREELEEKRRSEEEHDFEYAPEDPKYSGEYY